MPFLCGEQREGKKKKATEGETDTERHKKARD